MTYIKKILLFTLLINLYSAASATQTVQNDTAIQNAILMHINKYRLQHGLPQLQMDNRIVKEAKKHSLDMANHNQPFGHNQFKNRIDRLYAQIHSNGAAENVAYNYKDAEDVVKNWLRSPGHKRNIDGQRYRLTGIGVARDAQGRMYFTQIFLA
jgi:uncharacterized protein YkwD